MIYLDTHVVVWLFAGLMEMLSPEARNLINANDLLISPIVRLEIQYLFESRRIKADSHTIVDDLEARLGLEICQRPIKAVIAEAVRHSWTRDPFDRLIVSQAALGEDILLTKDTTILRHYPHARW